MFAYRRGLATATKAKEVLPLKGIKVLDMTRVLAGVSGIFLFFLWLLHSLSSSSCLYRMLRDTQRIGVDQLVM
jgi:hypothetical protein